MTGWRRLDEATEYASGVLVGDLVALRAMREDDLPALDAWWQDAATMPMQRGAVVPGPAGAAAALFRQWSANDSPGSVGFSVVRRSDEELVGHVTLWGAQARTRAATLGVMIGAEHLGRGLGTDAVRVLVRYGFAEMGLHRIELRTAAFNERGLRAYAKAGFVEEGRRREVTFHDGRFHDEVILSILEAEWRAGRG